MTERLSFQNMDILSSEGTITAIEGERIFVDQSPFYPQGGGQPGDSGIMTGVHGHANISNTLQIRETGDMYHVGSIVGTLKVGDLVTLKVNKKKRLLHTRLHSAGHIIDLVIQRLQPGIWTPHRGSHTPEHPYVSYTGSGLAIPEQQDIQNHLDQVIQENLERHVQIHKCGAYKTVGFGDSTPVGCGGTHVQSTSQIGNILIRQVRLKKGELLIKYTLEDI